MIDTCVETERNDNMDLKFIRAHVRKLFLFYLLTTIHTLFWFTHIHSSIHTHIHPEIKLNR